MSSCVGLDYKNTFPCGIEYVAVRLFSPICSRFGYLARSSKKAPIVSSAVQGTREASRRESSLASWKSCRSKQDSSSVGRKRNQSFKMFRFTDFAGRCHPGTISSRPSYVGGKQVEVEPGLARAVRGRRSNSPPGPLSPLNET